MNIHLINRYLEELEIWNSKMNLTGVSLEDRKERLIMESICLLDLLQPKDFQLPWADLGSGAGIPGIPLAIERPHQKIDLIESIAKKTRFLNTVRSSLNLSNVNVINERAEKLIELDRNNRGRYGVIFSRAFGEIEHIVKIAGNLLSKTGKFVLPRGSNINTEWLEFSRKSKGIWQASIVALRTAPDSQVRPCLVMTRMEG
jgi:16S rRNA (guanine527-N7)-methyltransferase